MNKVLNFSYLYFILDEILEELHRKVKPFIMRRDKMSVLKELPPKVIQDYYCRMHEYQVSSV